LQLVQLQPLDQPGVARMTIQNLSPQRQQLRWPQGWRGRREEGEVPVPHHVADQLLPWQLASWQVSWDQSS
jgi:hypothetical protein